MIDTLGRPHPAEQDDIGDGRLASDTPYVDRIGQEQRRDYTKNVLCDIGWAVKQMHDGQRVRRAGWDGPGMFIMFVTEWAFGVKSGVGLPPNWNGVLPFILMFTADKHGVPWTCSQTDLLALDWEIE